MNPDVTLNATTLALPARAALVLEGQLREVIGYSIGSDRHPIRWDTVIHGRQVSVDAEMPRIERKAVEMSEVMQTLREEARVNLIARYRRLYG